MGRILETIIEVFKGAINLLIVSPLKLLYNIVVKLPIKVIMWIIRGTYDIVVKTPVGLIEGLFKGLRV
jgi:hypothetical protein